MCFQLLVLFTIFMRLMMHIKWQNELPQLCRIRGFLLHVLLSGGLVLFLRFHTCCVSFWKLHAFLSSPKCASFRFALFCSRFFLQKVEICFHFHLKSSIGSKISFTWLWVHWFLTGQVLHLFVEYIRIHLPFVFYSFCNMGVRSLGR